MNDTEKVIEKILTSDARTKAFRKKLLKLGYVKQAKDAAQIMEKIADFGMMSDTGNKKVARAVAQAKDKNDLKKIVEKLIDTFLYAGKISLKLRKSRNPDQILLI